MKGQIPIKELITFAIFVAFVAAIYLLITGQFLEVKSYKYQLRESRDAENLLNVIVTSSPIVMKKDGTLYKAMINLSYMDEVNCKINPSILKDCCTLLQYDYQIAISDFEKIMEKCTYSVKDLYNSSLESACYTGYGIGYTVEDSLLINNCGSMEKCRWGEIGINITRTPVSELAFWISRACTELSDFEKYIILDVKDIEQCPEGVNENCGIQFESGEVCAYVIDRAGNKNRICKQFFCDKGTFCKLIVSSGEYYEELAPKKIGGAECFKIQIRKLGEYVYAIFPKGY